MLRSVVDVVMRSVVDVCCQQRCCCWSKTGIATQRSAPANLLGGINGGYFWRVDVDGLWVDDVCWGKTRSDALTPAQIGEPNFGVGDGALITDGVLKSNNCDCKGFSRPALLTLNGVSSDVEVTTSDPYYLSKNIMHSMKQ